ncbi:MAG: thioredoxin-disulfide reductase [Bradymonadia bacterium]
MHETVVIGSGPAGYTAAIYLARSNIMPLILEGPVPGGQLTITTDVENYPGFVDGILGPDLMERMRDQAKRLGATIMSATAISLRNNAAPFELEIEDNLGRAGLIKAKTLIVATGASARFLGLPKEQELMGYGVSACATCDAAFYRDKHVAVMGGGDTAMEEAIFLTRFAKRVTLIHRREGFRAAQVMVDKARANAKIDWKLNYIVVDMQGTAKTGLESLTLENTLTKEREQFDCDGLFVAIGHTPNTEFLGDKIAKSESGYILTSHDTTTNIPGVFACGDVADQVYRQAVLAAGRGCMAAIDCKNYLENLG